MRCLNSCCYLYVHIGSPWYVFEYLDVQNSHHRQWILVRVCCIQLESVNTDKLLPRIRGSWIYNNWYIESPDFYTFGRPFCFHFPCVQKCAIFLDFNIYVTLYWLVTRLIKRLSHWLQNLGIFWVIYCHALKLCTPVLHYAEIRRYGYFCSLDGYYVTRYNDVNNDTWFKRSIKRYSTRTYTVYVMTNGVLGTLNISIE